MIIVNIPMLTFAIIFTIHGGGPAVLAVFWGMPIIFNIVFMCTIYRECGTITFDEDKVRCTFLQESQDTDTL